MTTGTVNVTSGTLAANGYAHDGDGLDNDIGGYLHSFDRDANIQRRPDSVRRHLHRLKRCGDTTNFTISSGTFTSPAAFYVTGNFTNNGGTYTGSVEMDGTSAQTIGGSVATTFVNLEIYNSAGVTNDVSGTMINDQELELVAGTLTLTDSLTMYNNSTIVRLAGSLSAAPTISSGSGKSMFIMTTAQPSLQVRSYPAAAA